MQLPFDFIPDIVANPLTNEEFAALCELAGTQLNRDYLNILIAYFRHYDKLEKEGLPPSVARRDLDAVVKNFSKLKDQLTALLKNLHVREAMMSGPNGRHSHDDVIKAGIDALWPLEQFVAELERSKQDFPEGKVGPPADTRYLIMRLLNAHLFGLTNRRITTSKVRVQGANSCEFAIQFFRYADPSLADSTIIDTIRQAVEDDWSADYETLMVRINPDDPKAAGFHAMHHVPTTAYHPG